MAATPENPPPPSTLGLETVHCAPSQRMARVPLPRLTAHTSLKATADTAYRKLYVSPGLGEAVCVHSEPSQCKARVWTWPALIT